MPIINSGKIIVSVTDDGAGIDVKKIAGHAENKKHISRHELLKLNQTEILEMVFDPGFSTKKISYYSS